MKLGGSSKVPEVIKRSGPSFLIHDGVIFGLFLYTGHSAGSNQQTAARKLRTITLHNIPYTILPADIMQVFPPDGMMIGKVVVVVGINEDTTVTTLSMISAALDSRFIGSDMSDWSDTNDDTGNVTRKGI